MKMIRTLFVFSFVMVAAAQTALACGSDSNDESGEETEES